MRRVLVADPCADTVESTAWLLRLWGHDVRGAESGPEILEVARCYQLDAVLMELGLPGMDGYEVAHRLRWEVRLPRLLLVAITGYGNERFRRRAWDAGFDHFLVKPADPEVLRELLAISKVREPEPSRDVSRPNLAEAPRRKRCSSNTPLGRNARNLNGFLNERSSSVRGAASVSSVSD